MPRFREKSSRVRSISECGYHVPPKILTKLLCAVAMMFNSLPSKAGRCTSRLVPEQARGLGKGSRRLWRLCHDKAEGVPSQRESCAFSLSGYGLDLHLREPAWGEEGGRVGVGCGGGVPGGLPGGVSPFTSLELTPLLPLSLSLSLPTPAPPRKGPESSTVPFILPTTARYTTVHEARAVHCRKCRGDGRVERGALEPP